MSKIEPYAIEDIKELVETFGLPEIPEPGIPPKWPERRYSRLILAYAQELARANHLEYIGRHLDCESACFFDERHVDADHDWLGEVLDEIGWPKEQR